MSAPPTAASASVGVGARQLSRMQHPAQHGHTACALTAMLHSRRGRTKNGGENETGCCQDKISFTLALGSGMVCGATGIN